MSTLEKLFIGFWIWHTGEWLFSVSRHRKHHEKYLECREKEIERLNEEIKYWNNTAIASEIKLKVLQLKTKKELDDQPTATTSGDMGEK